MTAFFACFKTEMLRVMTAMVAKKIVGNPVLWYMGAAGALAFDVVCAKVKTAGAQCSD